jgi:hypothetical protein
MVFIILYAQHVFQQLILFIKLLEAKLLVLNAEIIRHFRKIIYY